MPDHPRHDVEIADHGRLPARPAVSVGVITYNHEPYLARALDSVLAQRTDFTFEVIVYEDCSTDRTRGIALDYQRRHPDRLRVLYSAANVGVGENARRGIAAYRGRYAAGLDGDDFWTDPLKLQRQFDALEAQAHVNLCFTRAAALRPDGTTAPGWNYGSADRVVPVRELLRTPGMTMPTSTCFFRTRVLHDAPGWIFEAPVIDLFHIMAGAVPLGAWYIAAETAAYRAMAPGSWSAAHADRYHQTKFTHSRRMLDSLAAAQDAFGIADRDLQARRALPRYLLGREAWGKRDWRGALHHWAAMGLGYPLLRARQKLGLPTGGKEPAA